MTSHHPESGPGSTSPRGHTLADRLGGLLGLGSLVLLFSGASIGDPNHPDSDLNPAQSSAVLANRLVEHRDDILFGMSLHIVGVCLFIVFVAWIAGRMASHRDSERWLRYAAMGGGFAAAIVMLAQAAIMIGAAQIAWYGDDASIARTFAAMTWDSLRTFGPPLGLFVAAVSIHQLGQGRARTVLGTIGLVAATATFIPATLWVGSVAVVIWIFALSILLVVSPTVRSTSFRQAVVPAPRGA